MNSRRLIAFPRGQDMTSYRLKLAFRRGAWIWSGARVAERPAHVRFAPKATELLYRRKMTRMAWTGRAPAPNDA